MYAVVDIESTGSRFGEDRITEIAIYLTDGEQITGEWSSLVNPQIPIPPFITRLTGIDEQMVSEAPRFEDIAPKILELTEGRIFVAHNVTFDYHFLRRELERCGFLFSRKRLCTVRTTRKIFPGLPSYSLGKLCRQLGIPLSDRHRAYGDARATAVLLAMLVDNDRRGVIGKSLQRSSGERNLPPLLPKARFLSLPEDIGIYYFLDSKGKVLYVGKARNIRRRVASHFAAAERQRREARMRQLIADVKFEKTGSELIALLKESLEIKRHSPSFNRAQKIWQSNYGIINYTDQLGYSRLGVIKTSPRKKTLVNFSDLVSARSYLHRKARENNLCMRLAGLQQSSGSCREHLSGFCSGACLGDESPQTYNERVQNVLNSFAEENQNLYILGRGRTGAEHSVISVQNGQYQGYGYIARKKVLGQQPNVDLLKDCLQVQPDNADIQRILQSYLRSGHTDRIIHTISS